MWRACLLLLTASCATPWELAPDPGPTSKTEIHLFSTEEKLLATVPEGVEFGQLSFAPDGSEVGYTCWPEGKSGGLRRMVVGGQAGPEYDWVYPLYYGKDSKTWHYTAYRGDRHVAVISGQERTYPGWPDYNFVPGVTDGPFVIPKGKKRTVMVNGRESREWDDTSPIQMSHDHSRYAYTGRVGEEYFPVVDGAVLESSDRAPGFLGGFRVLESPDISPRGNQVAYSIQRLGQTIMVVNGKRGGPFQGVMTPVVWNLEGTRFAYCAFIQSKFRLVVDHVVDERFEVLSSEPVFSQNGGRLAVVGVAGQEEQFAVIDGERGPAYREVRQITFGPGGRHVAYVARDSAPQKPPFGNYPTEFVVLNGIRQKDYQAIEYLTFSGDGRRFAYAARQGDRHLVIVDGVELEYLKRDDEGLRSSAFGLTFSPDHRHLAWYTYSGEREVAVLLDGHIVGRFSALYYEGPRFSHDSRHLAFGAVKGRELWWKVVDVR